MSAALDSVLRGAAAALRAAGVDRPMADARVLVSAAASLSREDMLRDPRLPLSPAALAAFEDMIARRARRMPVARILGRREFRSLSFELGSDTLDPRPDSETVVDAALDRVADHPHACRLLDIGTGTGCLLLSLLHELPDATGVGTDIAPGACHVARRNARRLGLEKRAAFVVCDWAGAIRGRFDVVVSNPPYISEAEMTQLSPEVADHDPVRALCGGADGLDAYRALAAQCTGLLAADGRLFVEIGSTQGDAVVEIFRRHGFCLAEARRDLGGRPRCLAFARDPGTGG